MADLERFRTAQEDPGTGFATALRELRAGRKTSHWIWYVLPQLAGLGRSSTARYYGLADVGEATAYLRDSVLGARLAETVAVVHSHVTALRPIAIDRLMGSHVDALKLVSCLTLFRHVARALSRVDPRREWTTLETQADAILDAASAQALPPCRLTEEACRAAGD